MKLVHLNIVNLIIIDDLFFNFTLNRISVYLLCVKIVSVISPFVPGTHLTLKISISLGVTEIFIAYIE